MVRVEHVLESWKAIREDTAAAVEEFPAAEFDFRPAPDVMSFRETARHILAAGEGLTGLLLAGDENFATPDFREKMKPHVREIAADTSPVDLAAALRESVERRTAELAARPAEFFTHLMTRMDGQKVTRLEMLQFVKEHELTHRAQLFLCLRLKGIVPVTTRRRLAKPRPFDRPAAQSAL
jgi:uncharacterized damage-inducible protein DinB